MNVKLMALGGLEENGKNCYIIESENDIIVINIGSKKYDNRILGVDTIVNDLTYLEENKDKVKAIFISNAHSEQIGGLNYLQEVLNVPVYGSEYTIEFIKNEYKYNNYKVIGNDPIKVGDFVIESFRLAHSIFGTLGFLVAKGNDAIVYVSDYNFAQSAKEKSRTDVAKIVSLKQKYNIKMLMTESIAADQSGTASGDFSFLPPFNRVAKNTNGKLFISLYSDNILGMINIMNVAEKYKKKIVIIGKDLLTYFNVSKKLGYIDHKYDMFIKTKDIPRYNDNEIIVVVSGSFLEPFETLKKMAHKKHIITEINENDTVQIASEAYDEIEGAVQKIVDQISRTNCTIVNIPVNIPSHAFEEDIKMMLNLFNPEYIMPIKGEYRKLEKVRQIAEYLGYKSDNVKVLENGDVLEIDKNVYLKDKINLTPKLKSENTKETVNPILLNDRDTLTSEGYVLISLVVKKETNELIQKPGIISGGLMSFDGDENIIEKSIEIVTGELQKGVKMDNVIKAKNKVRRFVNNKIGKNPTVLTVKIEVK